MNQVDILLPMSTLVILTFIVLLFIPFRRFRATFARQVTPEDFALGESSNVPASVSLPNRNYMNLLELPVLFYVLCLALYVTENVTSFFVTMAWVYVAARILHSIVHISYNNVIHRLVCFATSNVILLVMWIRFITGLH
jgi:hypothetical protein